MRNPQGWPEYLEVIEADWVPPGEIFIGPHGWLEQLAADMERRTSDPVSVPEDRLRINPNAWARIIVERPDEEPAR